MCRMKNHSPFPTPLEYIDFVKRTNLTLEVLLESHTDEYWNIDGGQDLSEPWTGLHAVDNVE